MFFSLNKHSTLKKYAQSCCVLIRPRKLTQKLFLDELIVRAWLFYRHTGYQYEHHYFKSKGPQLLYLCVYHNLFLRTLYAYENNLIRYHQYKICTYIMRYGELMVGFQIDI